MSEKCVVWINKQGHVVDHIIGCGFINKIYKEVSPMKKDYLFRLFKNKCTKEIEVGLGR